MYADSRDLTDSSPRTLQLKVHVVACPCPWSLPTGRANQPISRLSELPDSASSSGCTVLIAWREFNDGIQQTMSSRDQGYRPSGNLQRGKACFYCRQRKMVLFDFHLSFQPLIMFCAMTRDAMELSPFVGNVNDPIDPTIASIPTARSVLRPRFCKKASVV